MEIEGMKKLFLIGMLGAMAFAGYAQTGYPLATRQGNQPRTLGTGFNFRYAAGRSTPCVVHINALFPQQMSAADRTMLSQLFGEKFFREYLQPLDSQLNVREASSSGVIVSSNGFIVTNYHAVAGARIINVTLADQRTFVADLVGQDSISDVALLRVKEFGLPYIEFGDSDSTWVGDWVLAVGNPLDLSSTVTAGIISAKTRALGMGFAGHGLDCYLQTDAVANPGNSGGALVDVEGRLVGIVSAIETPNGLFAGYSFAIPSNIIKRVVNDLYRYKEVRWASLGVTVRNISTVAWREAGSPRVAGVCIDGLEHRDAIDASGLTVGDVILRIDDKPIASDIRYREVLAGYRPGQKVIVAFLRGGMEFRLVIALQDIPARPETVRTSK